MLYDSDTYVSDVYDHDVYNNDVYDSDAYDNVDSNSWDKDRRASECLLDKYVCCYLMRI